MPSRIKVFLMKHRALIYWVAYALVATAVGLQYAASYFDSTVAPETESSFTPAEDALHFRYHDSSGGRFL